MNDCDDQCPDTPAGEQVDSAGCSCSQLDGDDDGVNDCDDQCPDTPAGEQVDQTGCPPLCLHDDVPPVIKTCPETLRMALNAACELDEIGRDVVEACDDCTAQEDLIITDDLGEVVVTKDDENQLMTVQVKDQVFTIDTSAGPVLELAEVEVMIWVTDESGNTAGCTVLVTIEPGVCPPPVTTTAPECVPSVFGLSLLFSTLFRAPVCGLVCPLMFAGSILGLVVMRISRRRRR